MQQVTEEEVFDRLSGAPCQFCEDGDLVAGTYKDNDAMICGECGMPAVQLW